jgi:hypothetical protein
MKNNPTKTKAMPRLQTLTECPRREKRTELAPSNGLNVISTTNNINVQFAPLSQTIFEIRIKQAPKRPAQPPGMDSFTLLMAAVRAAATTF